MSELREQLLSIWRVGVSAVDSNQLVKNVLHRNGDQLSVCSENYTLSNLSRIIVVGAGKAGAGMAQAVEEVLGPEVLAQKVIGWVNVPEDCVRPLQRIVLHAARPAVINEPTSEGVAGSLKILQLVERMRETDLCLTLLSGGGSALLPAPCFGVSLAEKQAVTRLLSQCGATIQELNTVRKQLSLIKGGGLGRALKAGHMHCLIISDVIGDPLDIIASGPTVDDPSTPQLALDVLDRVVGDRNRVPNSIIQLLIERSQSGHSIAPAIDAQRVKNVIIGNNSVAVEAAAAQARRMNFDVEILGVGLPGIASDIGRDLAQRCLQARTAAACRSDDNGSRPLCLISGGEPVVKLAATDRPRRGGRNQELVLAAADVIRGDAERIALVSGGTDGEDGPTDAAGAYFDQSVANSMIQQGLNPADFLAINNSYEFFDRTNGLLKTGPTHTNVMDLRVALIDRAAY